MKKLNADTLQERRQQLSRRSFLCSVPTITTVLLATQAAPLFAPFASFAPFDAHFPSPQLPSSSPPSLPSSPSTRKLNFPPFVPSQA